MRVTEIQRRSVGRQPGCAERAAVPRAGLYERVLWGRNLQAGLPFPNLQPIIFYLNSSIKKLVLYRSCFKLLLELGAFVLVENPWGLGVDPVSRLSPLR